MTAQSLFLDLSARGVVLEIADEKLIFDAPTGVLTDDDRAELRRLKPDLLMLLSTPTAPPVAPAPAGQRRSTRHADIYTSDVFNAAKCNAETERTHDDGTPMYNAEQKAYRRAFAGKLTGGKL
jgi:hypothetical protein